MVRSKSLRFAFAVALIALLSMPVTAALAIDSPTPVSPGPGPQGSPRTDGSVVVWADGRAGIPFTSDVYGYSFAEDIEFAIAAGTAHQTQPDVDGQWVVWSEDGVIRATDLTRGEFYDVSAGPEDTYPAVSGWYVVWLSYRDTGVSLWSRNLATMGDPVHLADLDGAVVDRPAIHDGRVVWGEQLGEQPPTGWLLHSIRVDGSDRQVIAQQEASMLFGFDFREGVVVFVAGDDLWKVDIDGNERIWLATNAMMPTTDGRYVFWSDTSYLDVTDQRVDLWGYDLYSHSRFGILLDRGRNVLPHTGGEYLVWSRGFVPAEINVYAAPVADVLPTARRADPGFQSPDWFYFSETGHYLAHGFKFFWETSGGLPVFGFPLTIEYDEWNRDLQEFRTVQYTERQRYEYHPEYAGTPYETSLGRLGVEDAKRRGLLDTQPFHPISFPAEGDPDCTYFPVTGHKVCRGFRAYWESHGLNFGDPGVSFRESLALFGYPISGEFTDPDSGLTIQYFERARFEYHPDNPEPYRILLGRLGAIELNERGW